MMANRERKYDTPEVRPAVRTVIPGLKSSGCADVSFNNERTLSLDPFVRERLKNMQLSSSKLVFAVLFCWLSLLLLLVCWLLFLGPDDFATFFALFLNFEGWPSHTVCC